MQGLVLIFAAGWRRNVRSPDRLRNLQITVVLGLNIVVDHYLAYFSFQDNEFASRQLRTVQSHL
jgi:hypothetical protein